MDSFLQFLERLKIVGLEWYKRYYSEYPAQVVDVNDPEKRGRIKFKCPVIFGADYVHPVWAEPSDFRIVGKGSGEFFTPYIGTWVQVMFEFGDSKSPIYKGGYHAKGELPEDFMTGYPNVRGWVFKSGQKIIIDETKNKEKITIHNTDGSEFVMDGTNGNESVSMVHKTGAKSIIDKDGNVLSSNKSGNSSIAVKEDTVDVISNGKVNVTGKADVSINGDGSASFSGKSGTKVGSSSSQTSIDGATVAIAGGGSPIAKLGSKGIGIGNMGAPVSITIISGSTKATTG